MQTGVSQTAPPPTTWFNVRRMRILFNILWTLDLLLILIWAGGSLYLALNFPPACMESQRNAHFFILIHFALWAAINEALSEIQKEEMRFRDAGLPLPEMLPYEIYAPRSWAGLGALSGLGDVTLLTWGCQSLVLFAGSGDACQTARILHVLYDSIALFVTLASLSVFVFFAVFTISVERKANFLKIHQIAAATEKEKEKDQQLKFIRVPIDHLPLRYRRRAPI